MHKHAMEMGKWALEKAKTHGYDNLNSQDWDDLKDCMEVVKNAICADKEYREVDEMDEVAWDTVAEIPKEDLFIVLAEDVP